MIRIIEVPIAFVAAMGVKGAAKVCGLLNRVRKWECKIYSRVTGNNKSYSELEHEMTTDVIAYLFGIGSITIFIWLCCSAFFR